MTRQGATLLVLRPLTRPDRLVGMSDLEENPALRVRTASERREEMRREAAAMGIDEAYISELMETFYGRVREHPRLGPIFAGTVDGHWPEHLEKLKRFWSSVALGTGSYSGRPVPAHLKLDDVQPADFEAWLGLFEQTLRDTSPTPEAARFFLERAHRIARSLKMAMFTMEGMPALAGRPAGAPRASDPRHKVLDLPDFGEKS